MENSSLLDLIFKYKKCEKGRDEKGRVLNNNFF
jgi:hypothetical protein